MKMGVTIKCKKTGRNIDLGYSGFMRLRRKVAELMGEPFCGHYKKLYDAPPLMRPDEKRSSIRNGTRKQSGLSVKTPFP